MEESCEVNEEDKNSKKRTLKTPSQVEALEKLYNEHKYPTELLKSELAEKIGLSEKQVSGWFCHRRLKDKNGVKDEAHGIGRQELSSGIIQDRGSALKQDSCSSTKPGDYKHLDPKEVESRMFCGQDSPVDDHTYRNSGQYMHARNYSNMDNTSSGSTSPSQERMSPGSKDHYDMKPLKYSSRSSNYSLVDIKELDPREHMMRSEYLNSQDEIEDAAILTVKRQLGRHYREDGPSLGVKFESLPPTAFDAPVEDTNNGPCYQGDSILPKSVGVLKVHKESAFAKGNTLNRGVRPHRSYSGGDVKQIRLEPGHQNDFISYQSLGKSSLTNCKSPGPYSSEENIDDDPAGFPNKGRNHGRRRSPHGLEKIRPKSSRNHFLPPYDKNVITSGSSYPRLHNHDGSSSHMLHKVEHIRGRPSMILHGTERLDEESVYRERKRSKEHGNSIRGNMQQLNNERRKKKKRSDERVPLDYSSKTPSPHLLLHWENQMKGYAGEIPTSFSDDETVVTNSSID